MITLWFDGNKDPRSATSSYRIENECKLIKEETISFPMTVETENNIPINRPTVPELEYFSLLHGLRATLKWIEETSYGTAINTCITAKGDSMLVIQQMTGKWETRKGRLRILRSECRTAAAALKEVKYIWVPRSENKVG